MHKNSRIQEAEEAEEAEEEGGASRRFISLIASYVH
jgi:hypothetical protein